MCGRFTQTFQPDQAKLFLDLAEAPSAFRPRYNVAPGQDVAVARRGAGGGRTLSMLRWGLLPSWAGDRRTGARLINARAETARVRPSFQAACAARRCLVPADGFYEWTGGAAKRPWWIGMKDGGPFAFAGIWERSAGPHGAAGGIETFAILTTEANAAVARIHRRMPAILDRDRFGPWLAGEEVPLGPYPADAMTARPVSALVNDPGNDDPRCLAAAAEQGRLL